MKVNNYKCEKCGNIEDHADMYNAQFCYKCIDINTGSLKEDIERFNV